MTGRQTFSGSGYTRSVFDFIERLDRQSDTGAAMELAAAEYFGRGFTSILVSGVPRGEQRLDQAVLAMRFPEALMKIYCEREFPKVCPLMARVKSSLVSFEWNDVRSERADDPEVKELWGVRSDFSLRNGFVVPVHRHATGTAFVSFGTDRPDGPIAHKADLHLMALYLFDRIAHLHRAARKPPCLSEREKEVLTWVAAGKTAWEIGEILGIAKRTVDEHIRIAAQKLGAVNRAQTVVVALREGLIAV